MDRRTAFARSYRDIHGDYPDIPSPEVAEEAEVGWSDLPTSDYIWMILIAFAGVGAVIMLGIVGFVLYCFATAS